MSMMTVSKLSTIAPISNPIVYDVYMFGFFYGFN
jgi:hypothetical protein